MHLFKELSFGERWHVRRLVYRGQAPEDPRMAAAAVALAEGYERRGHMTSIRWGSIFLVTLMVPATIYASVVGDARQAAIWGAYVLVLAAHLTFNPATRPQRVAQSLEASRRVIAPSG